MDGDHGVEARAAPAPHEQRLVVEVLEVAVDGGEITAGAQCSDGGLPLSEPAPDCEPVPVAPEDDWSGAAVSLGVPPVPEAGALVPGDVVPGVW